MTRCLAAMLFCIRTLVCTAVSLLLFVTAAFAAAGDIVFVTQTPNPSDFTTIGSTFGNHLGTIQSAPRGGDLWIRYADGTLKNLTAAAGYGMDGFQGATAIAVRDPAVHWDGTKVIFSMVVGAAATRYQVQSYFWQLYEITGLGKNQTPTITKVAAQPTTYNNVMPIYGTDDRIIFVSDKPRNGEPHLYPQLDEYESAATNSGLWSLNPTNGNLVLLDHAPSGDFDPLLDSYGRIVFTRWDHLQRDQQTDGGNPFNGFNYADESATAARLNSRREVFPEARIPAELERAKENRHRFNHFFPWQINEDGSEHETLNHLGRHELHRYFDRAFNDDENLDEFNPAGRINNNAIENLFHIHEDPRQRGWYYGIQAPEFGTHCSGQIVKLYAPPEVIASQVQAHYVTHPDTANPTATPSSNHSGLYRNPMMLTSGTLVASHTAETREDTNEGNRNAPLSRYNFRLKTLRTSGNYLTAHTALTSGISETITYYDPDELVSYSGPLWELQPVELISRTRPARRTAKIQAPEQTAFTEAGVSLSEFRQYLFENNLALIVMRDVTTRDAADIQQPFNLRVHGSDTETIAAPGTVYDVAHLQIFQGDHIRGYGGTAQPRSGRRVLPTEQHQGLEANVPNPGGPVGSVQLGSDGSAAAIVPSRRALTWQITDNSGDAVVRERYWLSFKPGEVRVCASCHGLTDVDQVGQTQPTNVPQALKELLLQWRTNPPPSNPSGDPLDPANPSKEKVIGRTPARQYLPWNGFLGMTNILELVNRGSTPNSVQITLFDNSGTGTYTASLQLAAGEQQDIILNSLSGFRADAYGLVTLQYSGENIDGRLTYYHQQTATGRFDFAYAIPFQAPLTEATAVTFNTYQPSTNPAEHNFQVTNWLSIANLDNKKARSFTVHTHSQDGTLLNSARISVPPFARIDLDGGHTNPGPQQVGLHRIVPDTVGKPYFAQLVRYGGNAPAGTTPESYSFAFPLFARKGGAQTEFLPIATGGGAMNWLEIANYGAQAISTTVSLYDENGANLRNPFTLDLAPYQQLHINAGALLNPGHSGSAQLVASKSNALAAQSIYYFPANTEGSIAAMYGVASSVATAATMSGSYNLFLGMNNWLKLLNTSRSEKQFVVAVNSASGRVTKSFTVPGRGVLDLPLHDNALFGTTPNSYGLISVSGAPVLCHVLRLQPNGAAVGFSFPTSLR